MVIRFLIAFSILLSSHALAQTPPAPTEPPGQTSPTAPAEPSYPTVRVGILSYLQYVAELENRDGFNAFDVTRAYINVTGQLSKNIRYRLTPDIRRITDGSLAGSLTLRVKYAFLQVDNLTPGSWLRFGLHQTPWLDFEESINRYRVQGTMFAEREGLLPGSGDFGVGYWTPLPRGYGEVQVGVYNGEGFTQPDINKYKSVQGRVTIRPLPQRGHAHGLRVSGFYDAGWYARDQPRRHGIVMASFEHPRLVAMVQRAIATERPVAQVLGVEVDEIERSGYSTFVEVRQGMQGWAGFGRYDSFDPNEASPDDSHGRAIAAVAYWFTLARARLGLVTNYEQVRYDSGDLRSNESRLLVQTHVEF